MEYYLNYYGIKLTCNIMWSGCRTENIKYLVNKKWKTKLKNEKYFDAMLHYLQKKNSNFGIFIQKWTLQCPVKPSS